MIAAYSILSLFVLTQEATLEPPIQSPTFAVAKASESGKSIAIIRGGGTRTVTYTVMVPIQKTIIDDEGKEKQITETVPATRTRKIANRRLRTETYEVEVPFTVQEKDKDGNVKEVTKTRTETRTRTVAEKAGDSKPELHRIADCKFTDLNGKPVDAAEVTLRLKKLSPIVLARKEIKIDPFYRAALNPQILLVTLPQSKPKLPESSRP